MSTATTTTATLTATLTTADKQVQSNETAKSLRIQGMKDHRNDEQYHKATTFTALFSVAAYLYAVSSLVSWWFFLVPNTHLPATIGSVKPYSMETSATTSSIWDANIRNVGLMTAFGFVHSLLARNTTKARMNLPRSIERSFFCAQGAFLLHMVQHCWLDVGVDESSSMTSTPHFSTIWDLTGKAQATRVILGLFWFGAAFLLSSTFALDHFHLFGLSQGFGTDLSKKLGLSFDPLETEGCLKTRWHYRIVAHPIMTGMFLTLWCTPVMTFSRLVCACYLSAYILIAVLRFEERTIRLELGDGYVDYLAKTPRFFPGSLEQLLGHVSSSKTNASQAWSTERSAATKKIKSL